MGRVEKRKTRGEREIEELDTFTIAAVAADAKVDPRTVRRALEGRTKSTTVREAIGAAFEARGLRHCARAVAGGA